jgi:phosphoribosylanthranilate isomerase
VNRHLRIKICGVTNPADAVLAAELGADAVGLNFHPGSPRSIDPTTATAILQELPVWTEAVGVFVNRPLRDIAAMLQPLERIRTIQWHGDAEQREVASVAPYHLIAAFAVRDAASLDTIVRYLDQCRALGQLPAAVLVDAHVPGQHGGTGRTAPWEMVAKFNFGVPVILAGGLTPENVAEAVRIVQPWSVDVASGVEEDPRRKDTDKMRRFIANARAAQARLYGE